MALRYWVGGTASWDGTAGTKWATTDGGTGGAAVPTSADDVFFTALSGANTVTIAAGNTGAKSIDCTGFTGTIAGSAAITVSGSILLVAGMTFTYVGAVTINGTGTLTTAGQTFPALTISGSGITVTLGDALTISSGNNLTITQGTFTTANYNITCNALLSNGVTNTRVFNFGSSTITCNGAGGFSINNTTNATVNAGTSSIILTNATATFTSASTGGVLQTYYNVSFTSTATGTRTITGNSVFNNFSATAPSVAGIATFTFSGSQTINGTLSTTSTAGNRRVLFAGVTTGLAQTLTVNATPSLTDADFRDLYIVGTAAPISGTRIGDLGDCSGITFSTPKTVYWVTAAGGSWSGNNWAATSGGAANTDNFPLAQDTGKIENTGLNTSATVTLDAVLPIATVDTSSRTTAMTLQQAAGTPSLNFYGDYILSSSVTLGTAAATYNFLKRGIQTITTSGQAVNGSINFVVNSYGGTVQLSSALNLASNTLIITNGTFDTKNYNVTALTITSNSGNVRALKLGSSTITLSGSLNFAASNFTFDCGTSTISFNGSNVTFAGANQTFYVISSTYSGTSGIFSVSGTNTFNTLSITAPSSASFQTVSFSANQTITSTFTCAGASAVRRILVYSDIYGTTRTLTVGTLSANDCDFRDITIAGTAAGTAPTRAGDAGGNSGITFPAAKTVYWNLAGAQNWNATGWAATSGGTPADNNFPLPQDTAVFDNTGSAGTITFNSGAYHIGTLDASARTSAMTLTMSQAIRILGDWKSGTGLTLGGINAIPLFSKRNGTQTITSNGVQFAFNIGIDSLTGTVQLADALNVAETGSGSAKSFSLTSGTFDAVTYNVTANFASSGTSIRTLKMGTGTWTCYTSWNLATTTNLNFYKNTANIVFSDTSTGTRTFAGGGLSYNKFTIGGTTGIGTTTITGNNQFTELASTKTVAHTIDLGATVQTFGAWTVTGTSGNVVTLTGTGTTHVIAGAATSGIDYLAMGSIGFSSTSPGEFYAGANSTGTAGAPVYRTAPPTGGTRYWVGGTGNWSSTTSWSTSSGGGSGAAVPTSLDNVVFDSLSNATAYTATIDATSRCKQLTVAGPASGNLTLAGTAALICHDNITLPATGLTRTYTGALTLSGSTTGKTITTNGVALASATTVNGVGCEWSLGSALNIGTTSLLTLTNGTLKFVTYNVTCGYIVSSNSNKRELNLGTGTVTLSDASTIIGLGNSENTAADLTITASTSTLTTSGFTFQGNGKTFYNLTLTGSGAGNAYSFTGTNTFNDVTFSARISGAITAVLLGNDQTITGTLTCTAGATTAKRLYFLSSAVGTTRTLTLSNAPALTDVDFQDITISGAAAPISGTRVGDCKGNSGITFSSPKTVYWVASSGGSWTSTSWSNTIGGTASDTYYPLAQDTAVIPSTTPTSGSSISLGAAYPVGTIDMSARTSNTITVAYGLGGATFPVFGDWISGSGTSTSLASAIISFQGRGNQKITSVGTTFIPQIDINSPGGSVTLQDALASSYNGATAFSITRGTFDAAIYNVTLSGATGGITSSNSNTRTVAIGSGTWTVSGSGTSWNAATSTNLTVTGTGTIKMTSASAKTFAGGGVVYTNITLDQGGAGTLTVTGNNTFKNISNSYSATGATTISFGTTTQTVSQFTATGAVGKVLTLTGTDSATPCTLVYTGVGNVTGLDYLTITGVRAYPL